MTIYLRIYLKTHSDKMMLRKEKNENESFDSVRLK